MSGPTPDRRRRRLGALHFALAVSFGLAACGGGASDAPEAGPAPETPELSASANRFEQVARFGSGRALAVAATDSVSVIATTIGVDVRGDGVTEEIPTSLPVPLADVTIAPDAGAMLLVADSGAGELWTVDAPRVLASFDSVLSAHFADDGATVDIVGSDSFSRVATLDGSVVAQAPRRVPGAAAVAWFGRDARALVVATDPASASGEIWTGGEALAVDVDTDTIARLARAIGDPADDRVVVGLSGDTRFAGSLVSFDPTTGEEQWALEIGRDATEPVWDVGHDGRVFAVAGLEPQLIGLDGSVEASWELDGIESVVSVFALGDTPGYVIVRSRGSMVFVDADGKPIGQVPTTRRRLIDPTPLASGGGMITANADGRVTQWDPSGAALAEITDYVAGVINDVTVSGDGANVAVAASDGNVAVLDLAAPAAVEPIPERFVHPEGNVDTVAFVPDGASVVTGISEPNGRDSFDDTLSRWDLDADDRSFTVGGLPIPIMGCTDFRNTVRISPDGSFFVAPFHDFTVSMRRTDDGSVIHTFPKHISIVWGVAISPNGDRLASSSDDWTLRIWDLDDFELVTTIKAPPGGFLEIEYAPDGESLIVSDISGKIHVLDLETESLSAAFEGDKDPLGRLSVSPDGRYIAAGSRAGGDIVIWDTDSGRIVQTLAGHAATVNSVEFTPDGRGLVSGSTDGTARVWRLP